MMQSSMMLQSVCNAIVVRSSKLIIDFIPLKDSGLAAGVPARVDAPLVLEPIPNVPKDIL